MDNFDGFANLILQSVSFTQRQEFAFLFLHVLTFINKTRLYRLYDRGMGRSPIINYPLSIIHYSLSSGLAVGLSVQPPIHWILRQQGVGLGKMLTAEKAVMGG